MIKDLIGGACSTHGRKNKDLIGKPEKKRPLGQY
jgi:hypothetical protein